MNDAPPARKDLILLVADGNMQHALRPILERHQSLGIRPISFQIYPYVGKADPGCYSQSHDFLRRYNCDFDHALVVFDLEGSGVEYCRGEEVERAEETRREVADRLRKSGWGDRADVVVVVPELEVWVWSDSPQVDQVLGWRRQPVPLREWLRTQGLWPEDTVKPPDPKLALETTLRELRRPRSSAIYADLAKKVSLRNCRDRSFCRLVQTLRNWFPPPQSSE